MADHLKKSFVDIRMRLVAELAIAPPIVRIASD
jgi:hypothetical protein